MSIIAYVVLALPPLCLLVNIVYLLVSLWKMNKKTVVVTQETAPIENKVFLETANILEGEIKMDEMDYKIVERIISETYLDICENFNVSDSSQSPSHIVYCTAKAFREKALQKLNENGSVGASNPV